METTLTPTQQTAIDAMPATAADLASVLGYKTTSGVYDLLRRAQKRDPGLALESDDGVWSARRVAADGGVTVDAAGSESARGRLTSGQKANRTKSINDWLARTEGHLRDRLTATAGDAGSVVHPERPGNLDMVMFRTDDHFGETHSERRPSGEKVRTFSSEIARTRVMHHYGETVAWKRQMERSGVVFDSLTLLMNGDHITNEDIFAGQAHSIDGTLRQQMAMASETYIDVIGLAAAEFPTVRLVCQHGNHGELRTGNESSQANADDLLFDRLAIAVRQAGLENVEVVTNDISTHTEFSIRGHRAYMRHGQNGLGHIGTSSAKKRWMAWLQSSADQNADTGWDVAYWGHYHELKWEPVAGRPVLMGGTLAPAGDYANSLGIAPGKPGAWSHTVSDTEPVDQLRPVYFD